MIHRLALAFLCLASPLLLVALLLGGRRGEWVFLVLSLAFPLALIALGLRRDRPAGVVAWLLGLLAVVLIGSATAIKLLADPDVSWFGGLPVSGALMLYGMGLLPLLLVPLVYAATFRSHGLSEADLRALRSLRPRGEE